MKQYAARSARYCAIGLACGASTFAFAATPQSGLNIGAGDSVYIDGKSFQIVPAKANTTGAPQIAALGARDLGPGAIIMRSGNKLYIVDAESTPVHAYDPSIRNQAYDPSIRNQAYDPSIRNQAYDPSIRNQAYDPSIRNQAYDPSIRNWAYNADDTNVVYVTDPDYVEYRIKKLFGTYWTPVGEN